jgi:hypothetical protein
MTIEQSEQPIKPKKREWEVQYSVKWVDFITIVQATDENEAIQLAEKVDFEQFTVTAKNKEVDSLEDIFGLAGFPQAYRTRRVRVRN